MSMILGPQNMLGQIYNSLTSLGYKLYQNDSSNIFDQDLLWQRQWGNSSIFQDTRIYIAPTIPPVTWFRDLDPDNVNGNLEFSYFVKNNFSGIPVPIIPTADVIDYFNPSSTPKSFLNPVSLKVFFDCYDENNYKPIISRFNMINYNEIDAIIGYFN